MAAVRGFLKKIYKRTGLQRNNTKKIYKQGVLKQNHITTSTQGQATDTLH